MYTDERAAAMRRHAIQIAAQLPDDPAEAIEVLRLAAEVVENFLGDHPLRGERFGLCGSRLGRRDFGGGGGNA